MRILTTVVLLHLAGSLNPGGPRHDNDHVDYGAISITPTQQQVLCDKQPFLPSNRCAVRRVGWLAETVTHAQVVRFSARNARGVKSRVAGPTRQCECKGLLVSAHTPTCVTMTAAACSSCVRANTLHIGVCSVLLLQGGRQWCAGG
jgi:hypothetical protein